MTDQLFGKDDVDNELGQIYLLKKELAYSLSLFSMCQNFQTLIHQSTKFLLVFKCKHETYGWRITTRKLKDSTFFKISRYMNVYTCSRQLMDHDHQQARSKVIGHLIKSKYTKDIMQDIRKE